MKILIVNKFLHPNGGSETYIFELGKELVRQGHQVEYFGMEHEGRIVGNSAECYTRNMDFHTGKLQKLLYPFRILYSKEASKKIRVVLEDFKPDIVHVNNFNFQLTPSILYEIKAHHIPIVFTAHDLQLVCPNHMMVNGKLGPICEQCLTNGSFSCFKGRCIHGSAIKSLLGSLENFLYKRLKAYRYIDRVICPSRFVESKLKKNPKLSGKTLVLRNFIADMEQSKTLHTKQNYVIYFGRYSKEKGVETLLRVCRSLSDIPFVFAGKGELEAEVEKAANIENKGFMSGEALHKLIAEARFSICASEWPENCPFTIIESQLLGTPVVGADIGGIPELIRDGEDGVLFESGNEDSLKEAISALWEDSEKQTKLAEGCLYVSYDNCEEYCKKLLDIYHELQKG